MIFKKQGERLEHIDGHLLHEQAERVDKEFKEHIHHKKYRR